jgi:MerR family transcriptional regulator/heat shock protein HspR
MTTPEGDEELALYVISVAAQLSGLHPQTLRQYDRMGLVSPSRAQGRGRRYSLRDIALLRNVSRMVNEGINLAGIKRIIELESAMSNMAIEVAKLRVEVDILLESNPERALIPKQSTDLVKYYSQKVLRPY